MNNLIIHHIQQYGYGAGSYWRIAYEWRGEWKPRTEDLITFLRRITNE